MEYKFKAYINGEFIESGSELEIVSPLDNKSTGVVQALSTKHIDNAFEAARGSFDGWRKLSLKERIGFINEFTKHLSDTKEELADIIHFEIGKKKAEAVVEIERTVEYINKTIEEWDNVKYRSLVVGNKKANINRVPLGVVLAISPFNYPVNLSLAKIMPALLIGNSVVFKPATNGSLTGAFIAELINKAKFPKGVFNLVTGRGREIGDYLIEHDEIDMVTFTGSVGIGKGIADKKKMIPLVLELGGNDAGYVRHDADLDLALAEVIKGAFSYAGQRCTAIKRLVLHKDIAEEFLDKLTVEVSKLEMEPLVSIGAANWVKKLIDDSKSNNDEFTLEGEIVENKVPAHIVVTDKDSMAFQEEAFGPLLPVIIIDNDEDIVELINHTSFGLQNSIFTKDVEWAKEKALYIESGTVNINRSSSRGPDIFPFSGVKDSGFGTQGIVDALESMSRALNIVEND